MSSANYRNGILNIKFAGCEADDEWKRGQAKRAALIAIGLDPAKYVDEEDDAPQQKPPEQEAQANQKPPKPPKLEQKQPKPAMQARAAIKKIAAALTPPPKPKPPAQTPVTAPKKDVKLTDEVAVSMTGLGATPKPTGPFALVTAPMPSAKSRTQPTGLRIGFGLGGALRPSLGGGVKASASAGPSSSASAGPS